MDSTFATSVAVSSHPGMAPAAIRHRRLIGAIVAMAAAVILGIAAWLTPSTAGLGTHTQLGLPECGWITLMDMPCPTCGMTTAFSFAAHGHLVSSFVTQPMGAVLAVGTAMCFLVGSFVAITGSRAGSMFARLWGPRSGWLVAGLLVAAWIYKVLEHRGML